MHTPQVTPLLHEPLLRLCTDAGLLGILEPLQRSIQLASRIAANDALPPPFRRAAFEMLTREMAEEIHASFVTAMECPSKRARLTQTLDWLISCWRACNALLDPAAITRQAQLPQREVRPCGRTVGCA